MHDCLFPRNMARIVGVVCTMLCLATMITFMAPVSAQLLPEITIECDDDVIIDSAFTSRTAIINCDLENPSMYSEKVSIEVQSENLDSAAPETVTIGGGQTTSFQVIVKAEEAEEPGDIMVNITATIQEVNGAMYPLGTSDSDEVTVTITEHTSCTAVIGQGGGVFESGDEVSISAAINCFSNKEASISFEIHLIEKNMGSSSWPNGFENIGGDCELDIEVGDTGENCNFRFGTPNNLENKWEGCAVIIEKGEVRPNSCPSTNKIELTVKKKAAGLGIELGGNESILEQLGITEEQVPVIAGSIGIVILIIGGFIYYRRKGQEYE